MRITVKYFGIFRNIAGNEKDDIIIRDGENVDFLLKELISKYGEDFRNYLGDTDKKEILETTFVFVNGRKVPSLETKRTKLQDNDCVVIMPLMTGG